MSLSDLASLGSFVSGLAVLASLVFLFFQMRQMTEQVRQAEKNQKAAIRQGRASILVDVNLRISESLYDVYLPMVRGDTAADVNQVLRFIGVAQAVFQIQDEEFDQYREGLLNEDAFASFQKQVSVTMSWPGLRLAWTYLRPRYSEHFVAFLDRVIAETEPSGLSLTLDGWNAGVAAELAKNHA